MEPELNTFLHKLPPELNSLLKNGLNRIYSVWGSYDEDSVNHQTELILSVFMNFNEALTMLMKLHGNITGISLDRANQYDEKSNTWILSKNYSDFLTLNLRYFIKEEVIGKYLAGNKHYYIEGCNIMHYSNIPTKIENEGENADETITSYRYTDITK